MSDLTQLRHVEEADVYKADRLAGYLRRERDDVVFTYAEPYLADSATPPVAFTLPKWAGVYRSTGGSVPAFFAGLLPEGLRLTAITTAARTSEDDHLSILLAVGADTIGDVRVLPAGANPADPAPLFDQTDTARADFKALFSRATSADTDALDRTALPGVQIKVSAQMISTPVSTTRGPAILKKTLAKYSAATLPQSTESRCKKPSNPSLTQSPQAVAPLPSPF